MRLEITKRGEACQYLGARSDWSDAVRFNRVTLKGLALELAALGRCHLRGDILAYMVQHVQRRRRRVGGRLMWRVRVSAPGLARYGERSSLTFNTRRRQN